jgi:hypothetical protein
MPSIDPSARKGVVGKGLANNCLGPLNLAVAGSPNKSSLCVSMAQPPSGELPKLPRGTRPTNSAAAVQADPLPHVDGILA